VERQPGEGTLYEQIQASPEFVEPTPAGCAGSVFPDEAVSFLVWYLLYVLLAAYEPEFMSIKLLGNLKRRSAHRGAAVRQPPS